MPLFRGILCLQGNGALHTESKKMTTTIKTSKTESHEFGTTLFLDILADGAIVGAATLTRYYDEDGDIEYSHLERIDIDEDSRGKGYGSAAIEAMRKAYGRIVAAPDSEDSQRLYARIGEEVLDTTGDKEECYLDVGFGVYEIC